MDKVVSGCDFDEVLLVESSTWDPKTMSITTPFVDNEDIVVQEMAGNGFVLDITAISDHNRVSNSTPGQAPTPTNTKQANNQSPTRCQPQDLATTLLQP